MEKEKYQTKFTVQCGKTTDSLEKLKALCQEEGEKQLATIESPISVSISVVFWTSDFPELICTGCFTRDENGLIAYELDFSESTL